MKKLGFIWILLALFALACAPAEKPAPAEPVPEPAPVEVEESEAAPPTAFAILHDAEGKEVGWAKFVQAKSAVIVTAEVEGMDRDGLHGFHVHEVGECVPPDFKAAGGHFNPGATAHACPPEPERHAGDFGNIESVGGSAALEAESDLITVTPGETSVVGRAVIVHNGQDDCVTQPTGDAGSRYACGVIGLESLDAEGGYEDEGAGEEGEDEREDAG